MQRNPVLCIVIDSIIRQLNILFHLSENLFSFKCGMKLSLSRNFWIFWAVISLCLGQQCLIWYLVSFLTAGQVQLESSYDGSNRTVKLGSSFDFLWNYTGDLRSVKWGTKHQEILEVNVTLATIDMNNGCRIPDVSQYNGRRLGSWNRQSPGQVMFTLNGIKAVDNQVFLFKFITNDIAALDVFDTVQLIVKGKNFCVCCIYNACRHLDKL